MFFLVPAYPGCPWQTAVKWLLLYMSGCLRCDFAVYFNFLLIISFQFDSKMLSGLFIMFSVFRYLLCSSFLYNGGWYMPRLFLQLSSHQSLYFSLSYKTLMSAALMNIGICCISQLKYEHLAEHLINSLSLRHSKCQWKTKFVHYRLLFINTTLLSVSVPSDWFEEDATWQAVQEADWKCL